MLFSTLPSSRRWIRAIAVTSVVALSACETDPVAPRGSNWIGERVVVTPSGSSIFVRVDRSLSVATSPTIVLISGLDTPLEFWAAVRPSLATQAAVFSYDRGGVGRSGPVSGQRPSSVIAEELHQTLVAAGIRPPYLLVAHSVGGLHARVFADRYRTEVAGVVLVDATHETLLGMIPPEVVSEIADAQRFPGAKQEVLAQARSVAEVVKTRLPDVPMSVITSMKPEAGQTTEVREWMAQLQTEWLRLVSRSEQVRTDAGHLVPLEAPDVVVSATRRVLSWYRAGR